MNSDNSIVDDIECDQYDEKKLNDVIDELGKIYMIAKSIHKQQRYMTNVEHCR